MIDRLLYIPAYEFHAGKNHILVNPTGKILEKCAADYKSEIQYYCYDEQYKSNKRVHIFIAWITTDDIMQLLDFIRMCSMHTHKKVIIHMPRSIDDVSRRYVTEYLSEVYDKCLPKNYRIYTEKDWVNHVFSTGYYDSVIRVKSIHTHRYRVDYGKILDDGSLQITDRVRPANLPRGVRI